MALINIFLTDCRHKVYQQMNQLRPEIELLICHNINTINEEEKNSNLAITTFDSVDQTANLDEDGWQRDNALYDKLIIKYNNAPGRNKLLDLWKRHEI